MAVTAAGNGRRRNSGFTLVEVLIVLTLLVTLSAILAPVLLPSPTRVLRTAASDVATGLRETRRLARAEQQRRRFTIDTEQRRFGIEGRSEGRRLPDDVTIALTTAESLMVNDARGGIDFFPDGSSTGGRVALSIDGRRLHVDIEWLTGRIRVAEVTP
jgi:general secretion pathway protein H